MTVQPSELSPPERIALLDEVYQPLRAQFPEDQVLVGGEEAQLLWEATVDCFAQGMDCRSMPGRHLARTPERLLMFLERKRCRKGP